jgi:TonB family protein
MKPQARNLRPRLIDLAIGLAVAAALLVVSAGCTSRTGNDAISDDAARPAGTRTTATADDSGNNRAAQDAAKAASGSRRAAPIVGTAVTPPYPIEAIKRGESGRVVLRVIVAGDGAVTAISVANSSGSEILDDAARNTVMNWRFEPALEDGKPVADTIEVPVDFDPPI